MSVYSTPKYTIDPDAASSASLEKVLGQATGQPGQPQAGQAQPQAGGQQAAPQQAQPQQQAGGEGQAQQPPQQQLPPQYGPAGSAVGGYLDKTISGQNGPLVNGIPQGKPQSPAQPQQATQPPPGQPQAAQAPAQTQQPQAAQRTAPTSQQEAWADKTTRDEISKLQGQMGNNWTNTSFGQWFAGLPKTGPSKLGTGHPALNPETGKYQWQFPMANPDGSVGFKWGGEAPPPGQSGGTRFDAQLKSLDTAVQEEEDGAVFHNQQGQVISAKKLKASGSNVFLQPTSKPGEYEIVDPRYGVVHAGGEVITAPPQQYGKIPQGAGVDLGVQTPGTNRTNEVPVIINNKPYAMPMHSSTRPNVTGVKNRPIDNWVAQQSGTQPQGTPPPPSTSPSRRGAANGTQPPPTASGDTGLPAGVRPLPGVSAAVVEKEKPNILTVKEASAPLFGSPDDPGIKGLADFGHLLEKPEAIGPLKTALEHTFSQIDNASGHSSGQGFVDWMSNTSGWTATKDEARANVTQNIFNQIQDPAVRDQVQQAYDATMTAFGTVVGLRKLTGASAAKFSVRALENELPVLGINTFDQHQLYDKLSRLAVQVKNGAASTIDAAWPDKGERSKYLNYDKQMQDKMTHAPNPGIKTKTNKNGIKIYVGGPMTGPDGKQYQVTGISDAGDIYTK